MMLPGMWPNGAMPMVGGYASPTYNDRSPGFLKASSTMPAANKGKDSAASSRTPELPAKSLRQKIPASIEISQEDEDDSCTADLPVKSQSMPNMGGADSTPLEEGIPSLGSKIHGTGECTPCAWFWKEESCFNAKDCRYCHICPEGELKKRKKQKVAKMRLGLSTPTAQKLNLSSLI